MKKNTPEISSKEKFVTYFDVLNIIACLAVLILHHNGIVWQFSKSWSWRISLLVECAFYWAVPIFLMLSGATLMNLQRKVFDTDFFQKKIYSYCDTVALLEYYYFNMEGFDGTDYFGVI